MENAKACASAALRDGEKSLKCIGFLDGEGVVFVKVLKSSIYHNKLHKMESFCPFKLHEMENFQTKKADAEMVSALGVMLWFIISTKMQDRGSCLRYP